LVRPDRILPPITRSAAVTTSLEADGLAGAMITYRVGIGPFSVRFKTHQRRGPRPVAKACREGGGQKKERCPSQGRGGAVFYFA
jgi:hypothetical protein